MNNSVVIETGSSGHGRLAGIIIKSGLLVAVFVLTYLEAIKSLVNIWDSRPSYSHGYLIPFVSLFIIYSNRKRLSGIVVKSNIAGGVVVTGAACLMLLIGNISSVEVLKHLSLLLVIAGIVLLVLGAEYLKKLAFPLAYLIFMVPVLDVIFARLHWPSQIISARAASAMLQMLNIPVILDTQFIHLPNTSFEVAKECSGVRFLISIIAMGIPLAYFTQKQLWRKVLLIAFGIFIVIPINSIRVTMIGIWAYNGKEILHGPMHIFQGLFVAVAGFIVLIAFAYALTKVSSRRSDQLTAEKDDPKPGPVPGSVRKADKSWFIALLLLLITSGSIYLYEPRPMKLSAADLELPDKIGAWESLSSEQGGLSGVQGADLEVSRVYRDSGNRKVRLYIGFFESQRQGKELVHYKLDWLYENAEEIELPTLDGKSVRVNMSRYNESNDGVILYWYNLNGSLVTSNIMTKVVTAVNGLLFRRTDGAIIMVYGEHNKSESQASPPGYEKEFVKELLPVLPEYFNKVKT